MASSWKGYAIVLDDSHRIQVKGVAKHLNPVCFHALGGRLDRLNAVLSYRCVAGAYTISRLSIQGYQYACVMQAFLSLLRAA